MRGVYDTKLCGGVRIASWVHSIPSFTTRFAFLRARVSLAVGHSHSSKSVDTHINIGRTRWTEFGCGGSEMSASSSRWERRESGVGIIVSSSVLRCECDVLSVLEA